MNGGRYVKMRMITGALAALIVLLTPSLVYADTQLVSHEVETITGLEIAANAASNLTDVDVGSSETTFTLEVDGVQTAFTVGYADALGTQSDGEGGLASYALLGIAGGAFVRFLRLLLRLGA